MKTKSLAKRREGRPTKYEPGMVQKALDYIASCSRESTELPTIEGLSLLLHVDDDQIVEYSKLYPEFHAAIKELKFKQKTQLMNDGMYGGKEVNAAMAIFLLKANHGLKEDAAVQVNTQINVAEGNTIAFVNFKNETTGK